MSQKLIKFDKEQAPPKYCPLRAVFGFTPVPKTP